MTETIEMLNKVKKMAYEPSCEFTKSNSLYSILDLKSGSLQKVFECDNDTNAIRVFYGLVGVKSIPNNIITEYPFDFALVRLADMDVIKGIFNIGIYQLITGSEARAYNIQKFRKEQKENECSAFSLLEDDEREVSDESND